MVSLFRSENYGRRKFKVGSTGSTYTAPQAQANQPEEENSLGWLKYMGLFPYAAITAAEWAKENPEQAVSAVDTFMKTTSPVYVLADAINADETAKTTEENGKSANAVKKNLKTVVNILCPITNLFS